MPNHWIDYVIFTVTETRSYWNNLAWVWLYLESSSFCAFPIKMAPSNLLSSTVPAVFASLVCFLYCSGKRIKKNNKMSSDLNDTDRLI